MKFIGVIFDETYDFDEKRLVKIFARINFLALFKNRADNF